MLHSTSIMAELASSFATSAEDEVCQGVSTSSTELPPPIPSTTDRVPTPYVKGTELTVYRHVPPEPTPDRYHEFTADDLDEQDEMTFAERSLLHPPLPGTTLESEELSIVIIEEIAVSDSHGAQVLGVEGDLVAKLYDPRYYPKPTYDNDVGIDQFRCADFHYTHEAAAYEKMSGPFGGTIVPQYHGSYTCELPYPGNTTRSIRLILMERVRGICMSDIDPTRPQLPQHQRANVIAKIVDIDSSLKAFGVYQGDLHPRNIMLCGDDLGSESLRVVFIDFGQAHIVEKGRWLDNGRPISPVLTWHVRAPTHLRFQELGWIDWDWQEWLEKRWLGSDTYAPITEDAKRFWLGFRLKMGEEEYASSYLPSPPPSA